MRDILTMQVLAYFGVILCLVASTHTKSVRRMEGETDPVEKNLWQREPVEQADAAEQCKCENGFCEKDDKGIAVCKCPPEWGEYSSTKCKKCACGKDSNCTFQVKWFGEDKTCLCKVGYDDKNGICKGTCKENPCQNGGMCVVEGNDIKCRCKTPFSGEMCEKKEMFDSCSTIICKNNGTCREDNGRAKCVCKDRFSGEFCDTDVCSPNPCQNGGVCNATKGEVTCQCRDRFIGTKCNIDVCSPNPCQNGGVCNATKGDVTCECKGRFTDTNCSVEIFFPSTTTSVGTASTTSTVNSTGVSGGRTRNPLTSFYTEPSTVSEINKTTARIKLNVTTHFPILSTERFSKGYSLVFTGERGSTIQTTTPAYSTSIDLCAANPCKNGGICRIESNEARCYCTSPFSGKLCEKDLCFSNPCLNGGRCKIDGISFQCECTSPYSGNFCEKDPCSKNPCQNGGTCFVTGNGFKCLCKAPYAGILCDADPCVWNPCKNGGLCKIENGTVRCFCKNPFTGVFCQSRSVLDLCVWNPCKNGGICKIENEAVKCFCKEPFRGEFCDSRPKADAYIIAFAFVSVLLVIILILVSCILCQRYKFRPQFCTEK